MKAFILTLILLTATTDTTVLVLSNYSDEIAVTNFNNMKIDYSVTVGHINSITEQEANDIKSGTKNKILSEMNKLKLKENEDYKINSLDNIILGADLSLITITIEGSSKKATGTLSMKLNKTENIADRGSDKLATLSIPDSEKDSLSEYEESKLKLNIPINVQQILNVSQMNQLNVDYKISNLDLIKVSAKYDDYKDKIIISAINGTSKLTGSFKIYFILV